MTARLFVPHPLDTTTQAFFLTLGLYTSVFAVLTLVVA
jgi:hypothetical protein